MPKPYAPPTGKIPSRNRSFEEVVRDISHAVFAVVRFRPTTTEGVFATGVVGSGFFVSPTVFMTCNHVMNPLDDPRQAGDFYQLISNPGCGRPAVGYEYKEIVEGANLHSYEDADLALLTLPTPPARHRPGIARVRLPLPVRPDGFCGFRPPPLE